MKKLNERPEHQQGAAQTVFILNTSKRSCGWLSHCNLPDCDQMWADLQSRRHWPRSTTFPDGSDCSEMLSVEHEPVTLWSLSYLVDDVDAVVDLLAAEDGVEVVQPVLQVVFPVAEWDDDGDLEAAATALLSVSLALLTAIADDMFSSGACPRLLFMWMITDRSCFNQSKHRRSAQLSCSKSHVKLSWPRPSGDPMENKPLSDQSTEVTSTVAFLPLNFLPCRKTIALLPEEDR